jgi:acetyl esterase/lipase
VSPPQRSSVRLLGEADSSFPGAHFFSSLETHRYQVQRHARKLNARAFAVRRSFPPPSLPSKAEPLLHPQPAYRLSPQYGFPCALHDCLAAYLYLLDEGYASHQILFSGDSSGAGLALVLLTLLRDQILPLPAGATLISPWVDLAHSFPSIMSDPAGDYIPSRGFQ